MTDNQNLPRDFSSALEALRTSDQSKSDATILYGLSALQPEEIERLRPVWNELPAAYRRKLLRTLVDVSETNFELNYTGFAHFALEDPDAAVREAAIEALWDEDSLDLMQQLIEIAQTDEAREVRAAATSALGRFILAGELGELPEVETVKAQDVVINILNNPAEDIDVRRRALESIANCGHPIVEGAIDAAYNGDDNRMQISAVFAMGRTYDERWGDIVISELDSDDPEMRYEAARAAGELELEEAVTHLSRLAFDDDVEIQDVAIWSLGEIGGKEAVRVLNLLAKSARADKQPEVMTAIEDALASAQLGGGDPLYLMHLEDE
jgi:HEAT repeat protein